ncbi:DUF736 family protein [Kushneria aurantia]|uniref:DUF736 family protein n=1 Tax=Kushneria aurantia TaxID=504092 RepID=UPI0004115288
MSSQSATRSVLARRWGIGLARVRAQACEAGRDYLSLAIDDPSFPATVYARLIEGENGTHDLIWSRSKPQAA